MEISVCRCLWRFILDENFPFNQATEFMQSFDKF